MRSLVEDYCEKYHICRSTKGNISTKARLGQYPLSETPFEKVSMDIIGQLTKTTQGHQYIYLYLSVRRQKMPKW